VPREFVILSAEPVTAVEVVTAAAAVDGGLGAGRLWQGGGIQIASEDGLVLAVLRSTQLEDPREARRGLGLPVTDPASPDRPTNRTTDGPATDRWWTEAYGPFDGPLTQALARRLADDVQGTLVTTGDDR